MSCRANILEQAVMDLMCHNSFTISRIGNLFMSFKYSMTEFGTVCYADLITV